MHKLLKGNPFTMAKDPAILFYTSDFLTGTFTMSDEQTGRYIRLLCLQHQKGFLTLSDLEFVCKGEDKTVFSKFEEKEPGKFVNNAMQKHAEARKSYSESRRNNRLKKDMTKICYTYDDDMVNVIVIEDVNEIKNEKVNVLLTKEEAEKIKKEHGNQVFEGSVRELLNYGINKPKKFKEYSSHYLTILKWCIDAYKQSLTKNYNGNTNQPNKKAIRNDFKPGGPGSL